MKSSLSFKGILEIIIFLIGNSLLINFLSRPSENTISFKGLLLSIVIVLFEISSIFFITKPQKKGEIVLMYVVIPISVVLFALWTFLSFSIVKALVIFVMIMSILIGFNLICRDFFERQERQKE